MPTNDQTEWFSSTYGTDLGTIWVMPSGLYWAEQHSPSWHLIMNRNLQQMDELLGGLAVTGVEFPSTTRNIKIAAGRFITSARALLTFAGSASITCAASSTTYIGILENGTVHQSTSGWPSTAHVRLAVVTTDGTKVLTIEDQRWSPYVHGVETHLALAGGTMAEGANIVLGTTTGTKIGTATTQKLGFYNATPVVKQAGIDAATGTATRTTFATGSVTTTQLAERVKALIDDLRAYGLL
jgi:hypothetical protein